MKLSAAEFEQRLGVASAEQTANIVCEGGCIERNAREEIDVRYFVFRPRVRDDMRFSENQPHGEPLWFISVRDLAENGKSPVRAQVSEHVTERRLVSEHVGGAIDSPADELLSERLR